MHVNIRCNQTLASCRSRRIDTSVARASRRQTTGSSRGGGRNDDTAGGTGSGRFVTSHRCYLVGQQALDQGRRIGRRGRNRTGLVHDGGRPGGLLGLLRALTHRTERLWRNGRLVDHDDVAFRIAGCSLLCDRLKRNVLVQYVET